MTEKYRYYLFLWKEKWQQFYVLKNIYKIIFQLADIITFFKIDFFLPTESVIMSSIQSHTIKLHP